MKPKNAKTKKWLNKSKQGPRTMFDKSNCKINEIPLITFVFFFFNYNNKVKLEQSM